MEAKSLIDNFNKATKEIKQKEEKPRLKICTVCKKPTDDWVQTTTYNNGKLVESQTHTKCEKCRDKRKKLK